ncbi:MAG: NAD(P)H-binding protein [Hyphomicrobiales bacterium]|nr:NAD(P)H-binding protein [Hyphomicrobiales bacterium]
MDISTLVVICADGDTGYRLTQLARRAEVGVIAVIHSWADPTPYKRIGAEIAIAEAADRESVAAIFAGRNTEGLGVACMVGGTPVLNSQGNINVIDAATNAGIRRFLMVTSIGCGDSADAVDPFVKAFVGKALRAKTWAEKHLQATDLDWTIIRAGAMMRRPFKGGPILVESPHVTGYINPTDLGDALFKALQSPNTTGRILAAVDADKAIDTKGEPLVVAKL